jgi:DNA replication initiation complex subunit (GINS family)
MYEDLKREPDALKMQEYQKTRHLADDIGNSRLRKIVSLSAGPTQGEQILSKLTAEEKLVYMQLAKNVSQWRQGILQHET